MYVTILGPISGGAIGSVVEMDDDKAEAAIAAGFAEQVLVAAKTDAPAPATKPKAKDDKDA